MYDTDRIENALKAYIPTPGKYPISVLTDAMEYSLSAGGKRIRPGLVLEFAKLCGGNEEAAMPFACAIEMIHTYSLIHDDLPCMDDDDMRRGKPSNHKVFGEDIALLAGDSLQSLAFDVMTSQKAVELAGAEACCKCANILASRCGTVGMVGGQVIDLDSEEKSVGLDILNMIDELKTGALIRAACEMGCVSAGADSELVKAASDYGMYIGVAFQIVDDILDVTSSTEELGKPVGSDEKNNKSTYVSLLGIDKCRQEVDSLTQKAIDALDKFSGDLTALKELALSLKNRKK